MNAGAPHDRQRSDIVLGQKRLEAGEHCMVCKPLGRQRGSVAASGERTAAAARERPPCARVTLHF
jgi:hypothetical protein